jgi:uncharacterized membrane protein
MESRAKLFGHAIHPILIVFPLGLLSTGVVFDLLAMVLDNPSLAGVAYWMIAAGIIGGIVAAPFGWIDWFAIPANTRAKFVGLWHGLINVGVLLLFIISWWLRRDVPDAPGMLSLILSWLGIGLALISGWLGGELVERLGVGVDPNAHLDAPSSLQ